MVKIMSGKWHASCKHVSLVTVCLPHMEPNPVLQFATHTFAPHLLSLSTNIHIIAYIHFICKYVFTYVNKSSVDFLRSKLVQRKIVLSKPTYKYL